MPDRIAAMELLGKARGAMRRAERTRARRDIDGSLSSFRVAADQTDGSY
jgi:hypothetical protein